MRPFYIPYNQLESVIGTTWTRSHIRWMIKRDRFPAPYVIGDRKIGWRYDDLVAWKDQHQQRKLRPGDNGGPPLDTDDDEERVTAAPRANGDKEAADGDAEEEADAVSPAE